MYSRILLGEPERNVNQAYTYGQINQRCALPSPALPAQITQNSTH